MSGTRKSRVRRGIAVAAAGIMSLGFMTLSAGTASAHPDPSICNLAYEDRGDTFRCSIGPYSPYQTAVDVARGWENTGHIINHIIEGVPMCLDCWAVTMFVAKH